MQYDGLDHKVGLTPKMLGLVITATPTSSTHFDFMGKAQYDVILIIGLRVRLRVMNSNTTRRSADT